MSRDALNWSRRSILALMSVVASSKGIICPRSAEAEEPSVPRPPSPTALVLSQNTSPIGPCSAAVSASNSITPHLQHYWPAGDEFAVLYDAAAQRYGISKEYIQAWNGSSEAAFRAVSAFTSSRRSVVVANPTWELIEQSAQAVGVPVHAVPLTEDYNHDVKRMIEVSPSAGLYFICNPNNPTGTTTSRDDIFWLLKNKPRESVVLVDEAYHEYSNEESVIPWVADGHNLIVLRSCSKIYGMAGMRIGFSFGRPDLLSKLSRFGFPDSDVFLPMNGVVAAAASLRETELVALRVKINSEARDLTFAFLQKHGVEYISSVSNCFLIETRQPASEFVTKMLQRNIMIGRSWPIWPTKSRVTIGTPEEMRRFCAALLPVMEL